jgi:hypothetical protein
MALEIRQAYGKSAVMTASFAPFLTGETVVQNYNALLSLAVLQDTVDFIGYFPNDALMAVASRAGASATHSKKESGVDMAALNEYAASCLAGQILPVTRAEFDGRKVSVEKYPAKFDALDFIYNVTPSPAYKFGMMSSSKASFTKT